MWKATLTRRDFVEICLGSKFKGEAQQSSVIDADVPNNHVLAYWEHPPGTVDGDIPPLAIAPREDLYAVLNAVLSSPTSPSPFTAFCRFLAPDEAKEKFSSESVFASSEALATIAALSMAEALILSDGRIGLRQLSPAACKRTLAHAWGRALAAGAAARDFQRLPTRWQQAYACLNGRDAEREIARLVPAVANILAVATQVGFQLLPETKTALLAFTLATNDQVGQENAWQDISSETGRNLTLNALSELPREERGAFLQDALRYLELDRSDDTRAAACAFIATKIAPKSLEHMDLFINLGNPRVILWYTLFAALQFPREILSLNNGLGRRIIRSFSPPEEPLYAPTRDISLDELSFFERIGVESLQGRLGHQNEIEVELLPFVTSSFSFPGKGARGRTEPATRQLSLEMEASKQLDPMKQKLRHTVATLTKLLYDLDSPDQDATPRRGRRK